MAAMILTNSGHVAIAEAMFNSQMYLAWGDLPPFLGAPVGLAASLISGGSLISGVQYSYIITAYNKAGETTGSTSVSVTPSSTNSACMLIWTATSNAIGYNIYGRTTTDNYSLLDTTTGITYTDTGVSSVTSSVKVPTIDTTSLTPWTNTPSTPSILSSGLCREIGRRKVQVLSYVIPSASGAYITPQGQWNAVNYPTQYIYAYVGFNLTDASTSTIYQYGLFIGTVPAAGFTNTQYITASQVSDPGSLLALENITPIYRNTSSREIHEVVMTF
jgi:hypothetical protein